MLSPKRLGIAGGILWGVSVLLMTYISMFTGWAGAMLAIIASIYPGYEISLIGGVIGLVYGFIDAFVGLYILAWLYNKINV